MEYATSAAEAATGSPVTPRTCHEPSRPALLTPVRPLKLRVAAPLTPPLVKRARTYTSTDCPPVDVSTAMDVDDDDDGPSTPREQMLPRVRVCPPAPKAPPPVAARFPGLAPIPFPAY